MVVDSWKFSMLMLYIFWDDWPISMIPGSNEQLQQELEYNLPKPDCYSWWISKMLSGREEKWYAIKLCFKLLCFNFFYARETYFKGVQEEIPSEEASTLQIGSVHNCAPVHNSILFPRLFDYLGIKTVPQPPYSPDHAPWGFWLLPKLRGCCYGTIEEMKAAVTKVIDTLRQEGVHVASQKILERYNKCIAAGGDNFDGD